MGTADIRHFWINVLEWLLSKAHLNFWELTFTVLFFPVANPNHLHRFHPVSLWEESSVSLPSSDRPAPGLQTILVWKEKKVGIWQKQELHSHLKSLFAHFAITSEPMMLIYRFLFLKLSDNDDFWECSWGIFGKEDNFK